jgi:hypothetical protein
MRRWTRWLASQQPEQDGGVCGNFEIASWNMEDLYAAVANATRFRIFMALTATLGLVCEQYDFKTAFLHSILKDDEYYVEQPTGLSERDHLVCKLKRALYGLATCASMLVRDHLASTPRTWL